MGKIKWWADLFGHFISSVFILSYNCTIIMSTYIADVFFFLTEMEVESFFGAYPDVGERIYSIAFSLFPTVGLGSGEHSPST